MVEVAQSALANDLAVGLDDELGTLSLLQVLIELRLQRSERLRRRRTPATENLEFQVIVKPCERGRSSRSMLCSVTSMCLSMFENTECSHEQRRDSLRASTGAGVVYSR